jgi:hypothetical protein
MVFGGAFLAAQGVAAEPTTDASTLEPFEQCSEVRDYLARAYGQQIAAQLAQPPVNYRRRHALPPSKSAPASSTRAEGSAASGPSTYTRTNVQEGGVDENDMVKTDGRHVYAVTGRSVTVTKVWPVKETREIGRLELGDHVTGQSLFLNGDRLVVFGTVYEPGERQRTRRGPAGVSHNYSLPKFSGTRMMVVDVSDPADPEVLRTEDYEGWMNQARMIGDDVYFVQNSWLRAPASVMDLSQYDVKRPSRWMAGEAYQKRIEKVRPKVTRKVRRLLNKSSMKELLPKRRVVRADGRVMRVRSALSCGDIHRATIPSTRLVSLTHIDLDDASDRGNAAIFGDGWQVYASHDNLYVAGTTYGWAWWGGANTNRDDWGRTTIHKFALRGDDGQPQYRASGKVDGWLLNQFSMSEYDGYFRIATTDWNVPGRTERSGNHLTILAERDGELVQTGAVRNLAPGERIYSMRMTGELGYMVTFRQTDPLYTLDLSDPTDPKVLGELKINGFSSYIHPLGTDHLLTVGKDADDNGRVTGLHLQIFDVSDLENPRRVHHKRLTSDRWNSWTPAMWDHHAFTFDASRNLLVLPMTSWHPEPYSGALVMKADPDEGFHDYGFLSHNGKVGQKWCEEVYGRKNTHYHVQCNARTLPSYTTINRSIIIDDYVVAIGSLGLTVHSWRRPGRVIASSQLARVQDYRPRR